MASLFPSSRPLPRLRASRANGLRWGWGLFALLVALSLRLLPVDTMQALDGVSEAMPHPLASAGTSPIRTSDSFPGSAYFFAQDAFAPAGISQGASSPLSSGENSAHVLQIERGPVALSMAMQGATPLDDARALQCMTNAIYYEAGNEPEEGQRAVAQVILNRIASGQWPGSVCAVIYQGGERADRKCQFTFSCDGSMARLPNAASWTRARRIAARALSGEVFAAAGLSTFYHTLAVRPPWVDRVRPVAVVGAHIFYRLPGDAGAPATYRLRYSGREFAQPGPYAFSAPHRPLLDPPGPNMLSAWTMTTPMTSPPPPQPNASTSAVPSLSYGSYMQVAAPAPARDTSLPQSTVKAEFRNSGRPLQRADK